VPRASGDAAEDMRLYCLTARTVVDAMPTDHRGRNSLLRSHREAWLRYARPPAQPSSVSPRGTA
jgi:hypothetical protein